MEILKSFEPQFHNAMETQSYEPQFHNAVETQIHMDHNCNIGFPIIEIKC